MQKNENEPTLFFVIIITLIAVVFYSFNSFNFRTFVNGIFFESALERITHIGKTTLSDIENFNNNGGLTIDDQKIWKGYTVVRYRYSVNSQTRLLNGYELTFSPHVWGKQATVNSIIDASKGFCGREWGQDWRGWNVSSGGKNRCAVYIGNNQTVVLNVNMH